MTAPTNRRWASSVPIQIHQPPPPRQALRIPARIPAAAVRVPSSSSASVNLTYSSANALSLEDDPLDFKPQRYARERFEVLRHQFYTYEFELKFIFLAFFLSAI